MKYVAVLSIVDIKFKKRKVFDDVMEKIDRTKAEYNSFFADTVGEVLFYRGRVLRKIFPDKEYMVKNLLNSGLVNELIEKRLIVPTKICDDLYSEDCNLILEHNYLIHVTYPNEWSFHMLKDAAKLILEINSLSSKYGYQLKDPHPYNIIFQGCRPIYVDFGSFSPIDYSKKHWGGRGQVMSSYWYPLYIWGVKRLPNTAVRLLEMPLDVVPIVELVKIRHCSFPVWLYEFYCLLQKIDANIYEVIYTDKVHVDLNNINKYKKLVYRYVLKYHLFIKGAQSLKYKEKVKKRYFTESMKLYHNIEKLESKELYRWSNYQNEFFNEDGSIQRTNRYLKVIQYVEKVGVTNVLEVGGNAGALSQLLVESNTVEYAICTDYDRMAVDRCYMRCKENAKLNKRIYPVILNILDEREITFKTRPKRLKCQMVIALAISHHLILAQKCRLQHLIDILSMYTSQYILVEFMPLGLWDGQGVTKELPAWYNLDWFCDGLRTKFDVLEIEQLEKNRILILAELKH